MRKIYFLILFTLCLNLAGYADSNPFTIDNGTDYSWDESENILTITGNVTVKNTNSNTAATTGSIVIKGGSQDSPLEVTLAGLNINVYDKWKPAFGLAAKSHVKLTLQGTNTLISGNNYAGLYVPEDAMLEITAATNDGNELIAKCVSYMGAAGAGIGGNGLDNFSNSGQIIISGGTITASSEYTGTGIGGGGRGCGNVSITGGTITAPGGRGAGIGNGSGGKGGTISISGGTITATGGYGAAGIGGGDAYQGNSTCGSITITGGTIKAQGGGEAAGIGNGRWNYESTSSSAGQITITGGEIESRGGEYSSSDIGVGSYTSSSSPSYIKDLIIGPEVVLQENINIQQDNYNGFVFKDGSATVLGEIELPIDITLKKGETLIIPDNAKLVIPAEKKMTFDEGSTLTVEKGAELANSGTLQVDGQMEGSGTITGTVSNKENKTYYTVSFDPNGITGNIPVQLVENGNKATDPNPAPTYTYYTLEGWYDTKDITGGNSLTNKEIKGNTIFYARWTPNDFTLNTLESFTATYGAGYNYEFTVGELSSDIQANSGGLKEIEVTNGTLPAELSLNGLTISGTPTSANESGSDVTFKVTANNGATQDITITFKVNKAKLTVTPESNQVLYADEDPAYKVTGVVDPDSPLNGGTLGKGETYITQGSLALNEEGEKNYSLTFVGDVEYEAIRKNLAEAVTISPIPINNWHNEEIVFTAPEGFTIALTNPAPIRPLSSESTLTWTKEGMNQVVNYTLTRTTTSTSYYRSATVSLDKTPPELTVTPQGLSYTLHASDPLSGIKEVTVDGVAITLSNDGSYSGHGAKGEHTAIATDNAGNSTSFTFNLDNGGVPQPPVDPSPSPSPSPVTYTVTLPTVEGAVTDPVAGDYEVEAQSSFRFYLTLDAAYSESVPVITTNRSETKVSRGSDGVYIVGPVSRDVQIQIAGIVKNPAPVGNETILPAQTKLEVIAGQLHIHPAISGKLYIYTAAGRLHTFREVKAGEELAIPLPAGVYMIRLGEEKCKVSL